MEPKEFINHTENDRIMNDEIVIYKSEDGVIKVDVLFSDETVWLTIDQMAELFGKSRSTEIITSRL